METVDSTAPQAPKITLCTHVRMNGAKCKSPALRSEDFCYFHHAGYARRRDSIRRLEALNDAPTVRFKAGFNIPLLEDATSVQLVLTDIFALSPTRPSTNKKPPSCFALCALLPGTCAP